MTASSKTASAAQSPVALLQRWRLAEDDDGLVAFIPRLMAEMTRERERAVALLD